MISSTYRSRGMTVKTIPSSYSSDISIHIPRERCDNLTLSLRRRCGISIHAPRERCDKSNVYRYPRSLSISIHAPLARYDSGTS